MNRILLLVILALTTSAVVFGQSSPVYCQFVAAGVMKCSSPQGLAPVPQTLPSSPSVEISPISPPHTYAPPPPPQHIMPSLAPIPDAATVMRRPPPDDTDLKGAYCTGEISESNREMNMLMATFGPGTSKEEQIGVDRSMAIVRQIIQDGEAKITRLQTYLSPRLQTVDNGMLLAAWKQGQVDARNIEVETKACTAHCDLTNAQTRTQCVTSCNEGSEAYQHSRMCQSLTFLPY